MANYDHLVPFEIIYNKFNMIGVVKIMKDHSRGVG
jgi:hypothetical protein